MLYIYLSYSLKLRLENSQVAYSYFVKRMSMSYYDLILKKGVVRNNKQWIQNFPLL